MTQQAMDRIWSFLGRVFPATQEPTIAFDGPSGVFEDDKDKDEDDDLRAWRDESYYWCMYGHW